jgi:hypothetical protein
LPDRYAVLIAWVMGDPCVRGRGISVHADVEDRAEAVAAAPDVARWVRRFKRCMAEMPASVTLHAYENKLYVVALTAAGDLHQCEDGYADPKAVIDGATVRKMSVGEW